MGGFSEIGARDARVPSNAVTSPVTQPKVQRSLCYTEGGRSPVVHDRRAQTPPHALPVEVTGSKVLQGIRVVMTRRPPEPGHGGRSVGSNAVAIEEGRPNVDWVARGPGTGRNSMDASMPQVSREHQRNVLAGRHHVEATAVA